MGCENSKEISIYSAYQKIFDTKFKKKYSNEISNRNDCLNKMAITKLSYYSDSRAYKFLNILANVKWESRDKFYITKIFDNLIYPFGSHHNVYTREKDIQHILNTTKSVKIVKYLLNFPNINAYNFIINNSSNLDQVLDLDMHKSNYKYFLDPPNSFPDIFYKIYFHPTFHSLYVSQYKDMDFLGLAGLRCTCISMDDGIQFDKHLDFKNSKLLEFCVLSKHHIHIELQKFFYEK